MSDNEMVAEFHRKFSIPLRDTPTMLPSDEARFRIKFLQEELTEFIEAYIDNDIVKQADALVDLAYVVHGTALMMGLPWEQMFNAVHACNMRKVPLAIGQKGRHRFDVIKPPGWTGPELELQRLLFNLSNGPEAA